ncbi:mosc domain protein [Citreicella sp. SE45]|nr:mosc domain protein [Citreicella sp. SE45]
MTARLAQIWRHPVKGIGREPLDAVTLNADAPMPGDRAWAFQHEGAPDEPGWQPRRNFLVVANGPKLAQVTAKTEETGRIALSHPDRPAFSFAPETEGAALAEWVRPLWPETAPAPRALVKAPPQGMGDNGAPEVSILSLASLRDLSERIGKPLEIERFRGNLVLDDLAPWQEFDWCGTTLRIGSALLEVTGRIERCRATEANPVTGERDAEPVRALYGAFRHRDFGVYARVVQTGMIAVGNEVSPA